MPPASDIDKVLGHNEDGSPITVADRIVQAMRAGNYIETAAGIVGIDKHVIYDWLKIGGRALKRYHEYGSASKAKLTKHEQKCIAFNHAVVEAMAAAEAQGVAQLAQLARGGLVQEVVTEKQDASGRVIERTVKRNALLPDPAVLMWRLERRYPTRWGRQVAITGAEGGPIEVESSVERATRLAASAQEALDAEYLKGAADGADATRAHDETTRAPNTNGARAHGSDDG